MAIQLPVIGRTLSEKMKVFLNLVFSKSKSEIVVGLKIGHSNIVVVEVEKKPSEYRLLKIDAREIPPDPEGVSDLLKEIFSSGKFSKDCIKTAISGAEVIIRFIQYPLLNKKELKKSLEYEAEKYIPFNLSEVIIDFSILEEKKEEARKFYSLALVAAKRDIVLGIYNQCKEAGLVLNTVDVDPFSCANLFSIVYPDENQKTVSLINIGSQLTSVTILHEGHPAFTRDLVFGGTDITKRISKTLKMSFESAVEFKLKVDCSKQENKIILKEALSYLIDEVQLSFNFFMSQINKEVSIECIYLFGGTSKLSGICEIFKDETGIETKIFDSTKKFVIGEDVDLKKMEALSGSLSVPLGLAVGK